MGNKCDRPGYFTNNNPVPDSFVKIPGNEDMIDWILKVGGKELEECLVNNLVTVEDLKEGFISLNIEVNNDQFLSRILTMLKDRRIHYKRDGSIQFVMKYAKKFSPKLTILNKDFVDALEKRIEENTVIGVILTDDDPVDSDVTDNLENQQKDELEKEKEERRKKRLKQLEKKDAKRRKKDENNKVKKKFPSLKDQIKEIFLCSTCGYDFATRQAILKHEKIHTGGKKFFCRHCEFKCNRKDSLNRHIKRNHKEEEDMEAIAQDVEQPPWEGQLPGDFEPVRSENGDWQCPCCSVSNKRRDVLDRHIKEVHLGRNIHGCIFFNNFFLIYVFFQ